MEIYPLYYKKSLFKTSHKIFLRKGENIMVSIIEKKIATLKQELAEQSFSANDEAEIEKLVQEYKKELVEAKKQEYEHNQEMIKAKIEALEELKNEEIEEEKKEAEATPEVAIPVTPSIY